MVALILSAFLSVHSVSATILDVTNAEKLQLATSTQISQKVRISDGFVVSGTTGGVANGFWVENGTENGAPKYSRVGNNPFDRDKVVFFGTGFGWGIRINDSNYEIAGTATINQKPWEIAWATATITHPAVQELVAPSDSFSLDGDQGELRHNTLYRKTDQTIVLTDSGITLSNGIYNQRPYFLGENGFSVIFYDAVYNGWALADTETGSLLANSDTQTVSDLPYNLDFTNGGVNTPSQSLTPILVNPAGISVVQSGSNAIVSGTALLNGTYTPNGTQNGLPRFAASSSRSLFFSGTAGEGGRWNLAYDPNLDSQYYSQAYNNEEEGYIDPTVPWAPEVVWEPQPGIALPDQGVSYSQAVFISGAGTAEANGIYTERGTNLGRPAYTLLGIQGFDEFLASIAWNGEGWAIHDTNGNSGYVSLEDVAFPWLVTSWTPFDDLAPAPTATSITQGELDAGVTVAGAGTSDANAIYTKRGVGPNGGEPIYNKVGEANSNFSSIFDSNGGGSSWVIADGSGNAYYDATTVRALPTGVYVVDAGSPPSPTVTRNDIASEANWQVFNQTPTALSFSTEPSNGTTTENLSVIEVEVLDQDDGLIENATTSITLSLTTPGSATLSGSTTISAVSGVASFNNLSINSAGTYTLTATSPGLTSTTSSSFTITSSQSLPTPTPTPTPHPPGGGGVGMYIPSPTSTPNPNPSGCRSGYNFSPETGEKCPSVLPLPLIPIPISTSIFTRNLTLSSTGQDVKQLQIYLNTRGFTLALIGPGSPGSESNIFGPLTKAALAKFQKAHDIKPSVGYFGPITRGIILKLLGF